MMPSLIENKLQYICEWSNWVEKGPQHILAIAHFATFISVSGQKERFFSL